MQFPAAHLAHPAPPNQAQGLDDASPLAVWVSLAAQTPAEVGQKLRPIFQGCGVWFSFVVSNWFVLFFFCFDTVSKYGRGHKEAQLSCAHRSVSGRQDHAQEETAQRQDKGISGWLFSGLRGWLGDEQSPAQSWSSSHAYHYRIISQDTFLGCLHLFNKTVQLSSFQQPV